MAVIEKRSEGRVLVVGLARPEAGNALNRETQHALAETWREFEASDEHLVAVVHGAPNVFSIGHDVPELAHAEGDAASPVPVEGSLPLGLSKPVIAAIEGPCYGLGFELALACDLRIAGDQAKLGLPDLNLNVPYRVASVLLPRITFIGESISLVYAGEVIDAERARALRILNEVVSQGEALSTAISAAAAMAERIGSAGAFRKPQIWNLSGVPLPFAMSLAREPE